jgi:hypothetical protein
MAESLITASMRDAVGAELASSVSFPVSESDIRRWAIAIYFPEPPPARFWDSQAAARSRWGGIVAPEDFNPFAWMAACPPGLAGTEAVTGAGRTERLLGIDGPGLANQLNGGLAISYGVPIRPGDVITSVTRLEGCDERAGRMGPMLFTELDTTWTNAAGELVKQSRMTLIRC